MACGLYDPFTLREFRNWADIEETLGTQRGIALVEHGNTLDLFFGALAYLSTPETRPRWLTKRENFFGGILQRWLCIGLPYSFAGPLLPELLLIVQAHT